MQAAREDEMIDAVIGLGANLGDRQGQLAAAARALGDLGQVTAISALYETAPVGPPQPDYLNAAARLSTGLEPARLMEELLAIERRSGRERRERWGPRTLDLDLLWIFGRQVRGEVTVPHPRLRQRAFALWPLADVAPDAADPATGERYLDIARALGSEGVCRVAERWW
jgi:2-amino-4-hydroxy-6-hydroxymethyldihydropteridine diphosphokinase